MHICMYICIMASLQRLKRAFYICCKLCWGYAVQAILQRLQGKICQLEKALNLRCCLFSTLLLILGRFTLNRVIAC